MPQIPSINLFEFGDLYFLLGVIIPSILCPIIAYHKGQSRARVFFWWFLGAIWSWVAVVMILLIKKQNSSNTEECNDKDDNTETKKKNFYKEAIYIIIIVATLVLIIIN
ncbi:MAG: hypothetical protein LBO06_01920 [Bacteroidales bacterium]|jgi:Ca2+/Na+ antiporter|nr:hypothetical protein [Bacteroidales bacterium]